MKPSLQPLLIQFARFDALPIRQRILTMATVAMLAVLGIDLLLIRPLAIQRKAALQQLAEDNRALQALVAQLGRLQTRPKLKAEPSLQTSDQQRLAALRKGLVPPQRMALLLNELVTAEPGVKLEQLDTLAPLLITDEQHGAGRLWQHRQRLTLSGDYFALRNYLRRLEQGDWQMYWESLSLTREGAESPKLVLQFSTLSEESPWLSF